MSFCLFVRLSVAWNAYLSGTGLTSPAALVGVESGFSAAGPVRSVLDILMAAGAYRVAHSDRTGLFRQRDCKFRLVFSD